MIIRAMNKIIKKDAEKAPPPPSKQEQLLTEIRDALRKG